MKSETYALAIPSVLLKELRRTAKETGLSLADTMRQSMKLGLPRLREQLSKGPLNVLTPEESQLAFSPDPEWDGLESAMARMPIRLQEE